jgi:cyclopropane fatty-acyl-phospholipid synthase-like methyltransferase
MNSETAFSADYWNGLWRERRRALAESGSRDCAHLWQDTEAARHYARQTADDGGGRRRIEIVLNDLAAPPGAKVLDIGSGPGPVTIPLARRASAVTAVEPAEGMRRVLEERIAAEGVTNITVAAKKWEEVLPEELDGPFDIVLSSFALGMEDL